MRRPRRILVADDDPTVREVLRLILDLEGHEVLVAADGPETIERLHRSQVDIVLLDLAMPGLDGLEVCRRIKRLDVPPAVVVISAMDTREDERAARSAGADAYIRKPFSPAALVTLVEHLVAAEDG